MIQKETLEFLEDLRANNYREWFQANRKRYEAAKENVLEVAAQVMDGINRFDPSLGYHDPKQLIYRINRDVRFSPNKEPYKTHFGVVMNADGNRRSPLSGYYFHIEPQGSIMGCGMYMPDAQRGTLQAIRETIDRDWDGFSKIIHHPDFKKNFGDLCRDDKILKRVPRGFDPESPAAEYLKMTQFYIWKPVPDELVTSERYIPEMLRLCQLMKPFNDYMNQIVRSL